ncbi:putative capsular polysaccharide modification protein [Escherichia coli]|uniref:Putative capsular polysaccharide modification protein n=1 Tax=Escherichia coli TaxID=562 RepID=A0A377K0G5_ECOLX|nr:putative capsular polysaccharide modification protein [Escherichia coli]
MFFGIDVSNNEIAKKIARDLKLNLTSDSSKHKKEIAQFIHKYYDSTEYSNTLEQKNEHLIEYVTNIIGNDSFAVFDLGTRGTSRDILSDILGINIPLYMFRETKHKCTNDITSYIVDTFNPFRKGVRVILPAFYELLLSDAITSTCYGYEKSATSVKPIVNPAENSQLLLY